ncbi:hypothetical protein [Sediminibacterium sp.]|uniref:hypothetical protein n=1 Tax=Sediminibacterium sp. TaxID=1917865 RepID=UPI0025E674B1|nr:hypothetical protein [Sediminibacterium sp.]MBW0176465.1 hypothetical protein [Sediminibacterium sp.]
MPLFPDNTNWLQKASGLLLVMIAVGGVVIVTVKLQVLLLPFISVTVNVIFDTPLLKTPLILPPLPLRVVAPVIV